MPHMEGLQMILCFKSLHNSKASPLQSMKQDAAAFVGAAHTGLLSPAVVFRQNHSD